MLNFLKTDLIGYLSIVPFGEYEGYAVAVSIRKRIEGSLELRSEWSLYVAYTVLIISWVEIVKIRIVFLIINIVFMHFIVINYKVKINFY
jgi:hypothetical protein